MLEKLIIRKDTVILWVIGVFLLYMLWFQYAFSEYGMIMPICAVILGAYIVVNYRPINFYKYLIPVFVFLAVSFLSCVLSDFASLGLSLLERILKYIIPMIAIYVYIGKSLKKLENVLWITSISCVLLAFSTLIKGVSTLTGAITLGDLNPNVLSTYLMLGLISNIFLLTSRVSSFKKKVLVIFIIIGAVAQLAAASRRGVLIFAFLCVIYFFVKDAVSLNKTNIIIRILGILVLVTLATLLFADEFLSGLNSTVFFQRLLGIGTAGGDNARAYYQGVASQLFLGSPIMGKGLGAVQRYAGVYAHSMYYELLACTGLVGTTCALSFFLKIGFVCLKIRKFSKDSLVSANLYMILWSAVALLITGLAVVLIYDSVFYVLLAILGASINVADSGICKEEY